MIVFDELWWFDAIFEAVGTAQEHTLPFDGCHLVQEDTDSPDHSWDKGCSSFWAQWRGSHGKMIIFDELW